MFDPNHQHPEDLSSIAPSVSAPLTAPPAAAVADNNYRASPAPSSSHQSRQQQHQQNRQEDIERVRRLPNEFEQYQSRQQQQAQQHQNQEPEPLEAVISTEEFTTSGGQLANIKRLRHAHAGIAFGSNNPYVNKADCPIMNNLDNNCCPHHQKGTLVGGQRCACTRKAPMLNLRREIAAIRSNETRHQKSQSEQLRQYKDEAKHLSKVSRAFREENARLQRVLEEKARLAEEAEDRVAKEHRRVADIDDRCQSWFVKLDDLREENDILTGMANKSRSEAAHLRAALDQSMSENLKLKTMIANNRASATTQQQQRTTTTTSPVERRRSPSPLTYPPSLFANNNNNNNNQQHYQQVQRAGSLPVQQQQQRYTSSSYSSQQQHQLAPISNLKAQQQVLPTTTTQQQQTTNNNNNLIGLVEDLNTLRSAVNELRNKHCNCKSHQNNNANSNNNHQHNEDKNQRQPSPTRNNTNSGGGGGDCSVPLSSHKYSTATPHGGIIYTTTEKVERAMDQIRQRVHSIDKELQISKQEEYRWRQSALEMKAILDSQNASDKERASIFQKQQETIRQLQNQQQYCIVPPSTSSPSSPSSALFLPTTKAVKSAPSNVHSATADITNLESQLQYAKGQIATLDFQLQTLQQHMNTEMEKLRQSKDQEIEDTRAHAVEETEERLREEIRQTTSGSFLEEMSIKLQETEKRLATLEMANTTSEATKRQQQTEIENLRARLERETAIAVQLEPTQRALAQAEKERDASQIKLQHLENNLEALRDTEKKCVEEIASLRARASKAEAQVDELYASLNTVTLKLHQEVECNRDLRQRLEDTVERSNSIVRESKRVYEEQLSDTRDKLNQETNQRVNIEARASALECNLKSVREEVERIRRVQLHWS